MAERDGGSNSPFFPFLLLLFFVIRELIGELNAAEDDKRKWRDVHNNGFFSDNDEEV